MLRRRESSQDDLNQLLVRRVGEGSLVQLVHPQAGRLVAKAGTNAEVGDRWVLTMLVFRRGFSHRVPGQSVGEGIVSAFAPGGVELVRPELQDQALKSRILNLVERIMVQDRDVRTMICHNLEEGTMKK